jgi:hypothetical protein
VQQAAQGATALSPTAPVCFCLPRAGPVADLSGSLARADRPRPVPPLVTPVPTEHLYPIVCAPQRLPEVQDTLSSAYHRCDPRWERYRPQQLGEVSVPGVMAVAT